MDDPEIYEFGDFRLDVRRRQLTTAEGEVVALMPKAYDTLRYLVANAGRTLDKDEMLREIWPGAVVEENNLTQNISALRKTLGERPGEHRFIVTVPHRGYRFVAKVTSPVDEHRAAGAPAVDTPRLRGAQVGPRGLFGRPWWVSSIVLALAGLLAMGMYLLTDRPSPASADRTALTIAVLPFKPILDHQRNEALELGMADSLITLLNRSEDLIVRPLSVTRRFAALDQDPLEAAHTLEVDWVLDGTLQIAGDRIKVSARLVSAADGRQLWAGLFEEALHDIFAVQDSIASKVSDALEITAIRASHATHNVAAYEHYMRGRLHAMRLVMPEVRKGIELYERAILEDRSYALPYAGIADAQRPLVLSNDVPAHEVIPRAKVAALRALELAPELPEANSAIGMIAFFYDWDWQAARRHLSRAVELGPNNADAHIYYAHLLSNLGEHELALAHAERARELNPISPVIGALEGQFLAHAGRSDEALERLRSAVSLDPGFWLTHHLLAGALVDANDYVPAIESALRAKQLSPLQSYSDAFRAVALVGIGRTDEARDILLELQRAAGGRHVPATHTAMIHAALGDKAQALQDLNAAFKTKDIRIVFLKVDPKWDNLRAEPEFADLLKKLRFDRTPH